MSEIALAPRHGLAHWLRCYGHMLRFDFESQRQWLGFMLVMELLLSAGMAVLYGFYLPTIPPLIAAFIVTGTPALALIPIGFASVPSVIADRKTAGTYQFVLSLAVPRMAAVASTATVFTLITIPGLALALFLSAWRYDVTLHISPLIVPAVLLSALMATSVGAALGHGVRNPMLTALITNTIIFFVLLFSPIVFPPEQFPSWLVQLHEGLPFYNMAIVMRGALSTGLVNDVGRSYLILGGWTIASLVVTGWIVSRRR